MKINNYVVILDYGSGNLKSVMNIFEYLGYKVKISRNLSEVESSSHIILPGVGSYESCAKKLENNIGIDLLKDQIITKNKPLLGICVGMQILSTFGKENVNSDGLNFIPGVVDRLDVHDLPVPQIGWLT